VKLMLRALLATRNDWYLTFLRVAAGVMILPHGLQKTFGWFGGPGFSKMMAGFTQGAHIPTVFAFLAIMAEFLGGIGLIAGFLTRIAAFGVLVNMVVAIVIFNSRFGFFMNWTGNQKGEGIEFHILAIAILLGVMLRGAGPVSIDYVIAKE
jgi:putative oxidoreductase